MSIPSQTSACHLDASSLAYQEELAKAYGVEINKRILAFNVEAPSSEKHDVRATWNRPLKPAYHKTKRRIPLEPVRVLDAPGMVDDYYLNLLHWSSQNVLAVALDKTIFMWHADSGDVVEFCNTSDTDSIASLQFDASGDILAIGTHSGETQIWNVEKRSKIRTMKGRLSRVGVLSWDKHILSAGARDGSIWNHDVRVQNHKVSEFLGHSEDVCGLQWRLDGQLLASGGNDNLVNIWDARSSIPKITKSNHMAAVKAVAWCPWQLNLLATGGGTYDRMIHFWNSTTSSKSASIDTGSQVTSIIWSRQYKELLSSHGNTTNGAHGSLRNHLTLWNYPSLNKVADLGGHESRILHTALSPDGETVASTAPDEHLKFWKAWEAKPKTKAKAAAASLPGITGDVQKMNIR
ncbi:WD40-repeat-containing domain protein [Polychytrium aggregatum]|uniref:WD40-repeat-containing domain protein n=1 Tax=Polychytrium aggregatum TaxID=110093 RepID=UPI0022FED395|nr:WD40-repeat-containing domain protein [Polychytrium aggregatum]KAI9205539.1 WD40-repeat-containing domain protein [Polychytrium aggregatum]